MLKRVIIAAAVGLATLSIAGCNALDNDAKRIQASCVAATEAYRVLTPKVPSLSTDRLVQVKTVKDTIIDPVCGAEDQPEYSELLIGRLQQATKVLTDANEGAQ